MNNQQVIQDVFVWAVVVSSVLYWAVLLGSMIEDYNQIKRARKKKHNNNKPARYTYGDESPAEVERMYREVGLIK